MHSAPINIWLDEIIIDSKFFLPCSHKDNGKETARQKTSTNLILHTITSMFQVSFNLIMKHMTECIIHGSEDN